MQEPCIGQEPYCQSGVQVAERRGSSLQVSLSGPTLSARNITAGAIQVVGGTGGSYMEILKVSARSRSTAVAGAIAGVIRESGRAEVQAIGAGAVNQAIKAVAIARGYLALDGIDVICIPAFTEVSISEQERTAVKLIVEPR
jgi:stage V sporulation protein S